MGIHIYFIIPEIKERFALKVILSALKKSAAYMVLFERRNYARLAMQVID